MNRLAMTSDLLAILSAMRAAGPIGLARDEMCAAAGLPDTPKSTHNLLGRLRVRGHDIRCRRVGMEGHRNVFRFSLGGGLPRPRVEEKMTFAASLGIVAIVGLHGVSVAQVRGLEA